MSNKPRTETDEDRASLARGEIPAHIAMPPNVAPTPLTDELLATTRTKKLLSSDPRLPWYRLAAKLERDLAAANARAEQNEKDAERYRWLKAHKLGYNGQAWHWVPGEPLWDESIDTAIDAAIAAKVGKA